MKKTILIGLTLCLCFAVFCAALAEIAETGMTAEELYPAGRDASGAGD